MTEQINPCLHPSMQQLSPDLQTRYIVNLYLNVINPQFNIVVIKFFFELLRKLRNQIFSINSVNVSKLHLSFFWGWVANVILLKHKGIKVTLNKKNQVNIQLVFHVLS